MALRLDPSIDALLDRGTANRLTTLTLPYEGGLELTVRC
jgi:hypothetical protein